MIGSGQCSVIWSTLFAAQRGPAKQLTPYSSASNSGPSGFRSTNGWQRYFGWIRRNHSTPRGRWSELAGKAGLSVQLHFIDVPADERWRRVETRNAQKGETYQLSFDVTREMFDFVEGLWEPPTDAEMLAYNGVRTSGGQKRMPNLTGTS